MNFKKTAAMALIVAVVGMPLQAQAQFGGLKVPRVPNLGGATSSSFDMRGGQAGLFSSFSAAQSEILQAQILLAKAFELKDLAATLEAEAAYIASGAIDAQGAKGSIETTTSAQKEIDSAMDAGQELSEEGKAYFMESLPHLLQGSLDAAKLPGEAQALADGIMSVAQNGSLTQKAEAAKLVGPTASLATTMPGFVRSTYDSYKKVVTYGREQSLPVPADATAALDEG